jgi:hypothetical protein
MKGAPVTRQIFAGWALMASIACGRSGNRDTAATDSAKQVAPPVGDAVRDMPWQTLKSETDTTGLALTADGTVSWRGRALSPPLMMRDSANEGSSITYHASPMSPSGRWALAHGRSTTFGRVYVLDLEGRTTRESPATKYGIIPWVAWSPSLPYAIVSNRVEGTALLYRIDLTTGEARQIDFSGVVRSPLSATPIESSLRWLDASGAAFMIDARVACNSAVERCDAAAASETRRFRVNLRTLEMTAA